MSQFPRRTLGSLALFGVEPGTGVEWSVQGPASSDWWDTPESTVSVREKAREDGGWAGEAFHASARFNVQGLVRAPSAPAMRDALDRLHAAASLSETVLTVEEESGTRWASVRREDKVLTTMLHPMLARWSIQLVATDPRRYGAVLSGSTGLPASSGGLVVPMTVPVVVDGSQTSGRVRLVNPGNVAAPVRLRVDGPTSGLLYGPVVTHVQSGRRLALPAAGLGPGEFLTLADRQVLAGGVEPRAGWLTERGWFDLAPGVNDIAWEAVSSGPGALLTVESWEAWA